MEHLKDRGNFKFHVCDPEHEQKGLVCQNCINQELIKEHERMRKPHYDEFKPE